MPIRRARPRRRPLRRTRAAGATATVVAGLLLAACRSAPENAAMHAAGPTPPAPGTAPPEVPPGYEAALNGWQRERIERLTAEDGWLTLVGLVRLEPGESTVGRSEDADVRADGFAADRVGTIHAGADGSLRFEPAAPGLVAGLPADGRLVHDGEGEATVLTSGRVRLHVIERAGRLAVRLRDPQAPTRTGFAGIARFPADPAWRIVADFEPAGDGAAPLPVELVVGGVTEERVAGHARFRRDGHEVSMVLLEGGGDGFFVVFGDATNGRSTYGGGRFLVAERGEAPGTVVLDFNRAYNPPCSYTPFATCPLPPAGNRLPFEVAAGEMAPLPPHPPRRPAEASP